MPFTPFQDLHKISDNTGQFTASQSPSVESVYRYSYQIDCSDLTGFSLEVIKVGADFVVSDPSGNVILAWNFRVTYLAGNDVFGFVWYTTQQSVTVTSPAPPPQLIGDPNGIDIVGGGSGATGGNIIFDEFESPIFVVNIPANSTVKITFHNAGFPSIADIEGLQVSVRLGGGNVSGFRHGRDGEAVIVYPNSGGISQVRAVGRNRTLSAPIPLKDKSGVAYSADGAAFVLRGGGKMQQYLLYSRGGSAYARVSTNDGLTYGDEMAVYPGYTFLGADEFTRDGILMLLNDKAGKTYVALMDRTGTFYPPRPCKLPTGVTLSAPGQLLCHGQSSVDFIYTSTAGVEHLGSTNDGLTWTQSAAPSS